MSHSPYLKSLVAELETLDINGVTLLATLTGIVISKDLTPTEQEVLGNVILIVGNTLTTISSLLDAQNENKKDPIDGPKSDQPANQPLSDEQEKMQRQINELQIQNHEMQKHIQSLHNKLELVGN